LDGINIDLDWHTFRRLGKGVDMKGAKGRILWAVCRLVMGVTSLIGPALYSADHVEGELLVKLRPGGSADRVLAESLAYTVQRDLPHISWRHINLPPGVRATDALTIFRAHPAVEEAELNVIHENVVSGHVEPNDPYYSDRCGQYGLLNTDAKHAWSVTTGGSNVVVAVMDTGINYQHEDLAANMWHNPLEIPGNFVDDDLNGFTDDVFGADMVNRDGDAMDEGIPGFYHGTACAGVIGAVGNNGIGLTGVAWSVQLIAVRVIRAYNSIAVADEIAGIDYLLGLKSKGVNLRAINMSFGMGSSCQKAQLDAYRALSEAGILCICSAGNARRNNDIVPSYPASYGFEEVVAVAASDCYDQMATFSSWGATNVDLAAPGVCIRTTGGANCGGYCSAADGTSFAAPHVTGAVALLASAFPNASAIRLKQALLAGIDVLPTFMGKMVSGGRLNLGRAVELQRSQQPETPPLFVFDPRSQLVREGDSVTLRVTASGTAPMAYQWQYGTTDLPGETNSELVLKKVTLADGGYYQLQAVNDYGGAVSLPAALTITNTEAASGPITWLKQPQSIVIVGGTTIELGAAAVGLEPIAYQWSRNGVIVPGASRCILHLPGCGSDREGCYQLQAGNVFGETSTSPINLQVLEPPVIAFGSDFGQLVVPRDVTDAVAISMGYSHGLALGPDGVVHAWGNQGTPATPLLPPVSAIAAGQECSAAITAEGKVVAWGNNDRSQRQVPAGLTGAVGLSSLTTHALAIRDHGTVVAWGDDDTGQCAVPAGLDSVVKVAAGHGFSLALRSDGTIAAWGPNNISQFRLPEGLSHVVDIAAGYQHALALKEDGTLVAWGTPNFGPNFVPSGLSNVVAVGCGQLHSAALLENGTVVAWSANLEHRFDLTNTPCGLSNVVELSAGFNGTLIRIGESRLLARDPLDGPGLLWLTDRDKPWFGQHHISHDGMDALQSPEITDGETTAIHTTVVGPGLLSSWYKISGSPSSGSLAFVVDEEEMNRFAGETDWQQIQVTIPQGRHTISWVYARNSDSGAAGKAWLDGIEYSPGNSLAPIITISPTNAAAVVGGFALFRVGAIGAPPLTYTWYLNGVQLPGANSSAYTVLNPALGDNGSLFSVVVANAFGSVTSTPVRLTVGYKPVIVVHPATQTVGLGEQVTLSVVATNDYAPPYTFEWQRSGALVFTETRNDLFSFYSFPAHTVPGVTYYHVIVKSAFGNVLSSMAGIHAVEDSDMDGMPNSWEEKHNLDCLNAADASQDLDGDGKSNLEEYLSGTNPKDSLDVLRLEVENRGTAGVRLRFIAASTKTYTVLYADDPAASEWNRLLDLPAGFTNSVIQVMDPGVHLQQPSRLYRLVTPRLP